MSAVLAAVTDGIYLGWYTPELTDAETRLQGFAFWSVVVFSLNAVLFTLVGLQLPSVLDGLDAWSTGRDRRWRWPCARSCGRPCAGCR